MLKKSRDVENVDFFLSILTYLFVHLWWRKIIYHCANRKTADTNVVFLEEADHLNSDHLHYATPHSLHSLHVLWSPSSQVGDWQTLSIIWLISLELTDVCTLLCCHSITTYAKNWWHVLSLSAYRTEEQHIPYGIVWNVAEQWRMLFTFQLHRKKRMETWACPSPLWTTGKGGGKSYL
jgi:hypothetical protein